MRKTKLKMSVILMMMILLPCVAVLVVVVVFYLQKAHSTFKEKGVKYLKTIPILTDLCSMLMPSEHIGETIKSLYNSYPKERFVGKYDFLKESVVIRDIELLKKITIKDFEHFVDHSSPGPDDSLFGRSLFFLKGYEWKDMRTSLSPAFTSSKIRQMVPFMMEVGEQMILSLKKKLKNSGGDYIDVECKDLTTRFANDVIASCAFGLKVDSHADEDNEFYKMGKAVSSFKFSQILFFILLSSLPFVNKLIAVDVVPKPAQDFFRRLVLDAMKEREQKNIFRPDMIHLLMEAKKGKLSHEEVKANDEAAGFATVEESTVGRKQLTRVWKDDDLVSQAFLFFAAGFESVSSSMSFLLYELALNPDVQERLAQEIRDHDAKSGGKFDFSSIQSLKYMDMVISELLRRWPPFVVLDRQCTKDYNLGKPNPDSEKDYILRDGADILIPVYGIHLNPEYFPNPEKFDPERFSDENKHNIRPFTYMPFGNGPRNCLGSRFALCEMKVITYQLIRHMVLSPCEKTSIPAKLSPDQFNLRLEGGHWLRFRLRD